MALTDTYTSPLDFETEEERRRRESLKFRAMANPILDGFNQRAAQRRSQVDAYGFRQDAAKVLQQDRERQSMWANTFSQQMQPSVERQKTKERTAEGPRGLAFAQFMTRSVLPEEVTKLLERVPIAGPSLRSAVETATSPAGLITAAIPGGAPLLAAGTAGQAIGGTVGGALEEAGVPYARPVGEVLGGLATPGMLTTPGKAAARAATRPFARGLEESGGVGGLGRRLATEETGGIKLPKFKASRIEGTTPEPGTPLETGVQKLNQALRTSKMNRNATEQIRSAQRAERSGAYGGTLEAEVKAGIDPFEANKIASSKLKGAYEEQSGINVNWTPEERQAVGMRILGNDIRNFERKNAFTALERLSEGKPITDYYINLLGRIYGPELAQTIREAGKKGGFGLFDILVLPKAILSSMDFSYPLRQGVMMAPGHPKEFFTSFTPMFRAAATEKGALAIQDGILGDPRTLAVIMKNGTRATMGFGEVKDKIGLLRSLDAASEAGEEAFRGSLAERIPLLGRGVRASNRAFTTFGNKFRSDTFDTIVNKWVQQGVPLTEDRMQALGNMLNRFTGRGTLMNDNRLTQVLQATWWAPQYRVAAPEALAQLLHKDGAIRLEAARNLVAFVGTGMAILTAAKLSGQMDVNANPMSSDFGKIRVGNTRVNIWGSTNVLARTIAQITVNLAEGNPEKAQSVALRYMRSGLAPEWSFAVDVANKRNYIGQPMNASKGVINRELQQRLIPLAAQDISDAVQEAVKDPSLGKIATAAVSAPLSIFGTGVQTYTSAGETFKDAFEKKTGREYNAQAGDKLLAEKDPELGPLYDAWQKDQIERGSEVAEQAGKRQEFMADYEKQLGLPGIAQKVLEGNEAFMPEFAKKFEDYQTAAAITAAQNIFGADIEQSDDPRAVALRTWADISPNSTQYQDQQTGQTDWDAYFRDKEAAFAKLDPALQQAIKERLKGIDSSVQQVEPRFKQAREDAQAYYDIPKYVGLSKEEGDQVDEVRRAIDFVAMNNDLRQQRSVSVLSRGGGMTPLTSPEEQPFDSQGAFNLIKDRIDPKIADYVQQNFLPRATVRSLSSRGQSLTPLRIKRPDVQNPERDQFALAHPDLIYFGLISLSTLARTQQQELDTGFLSRNVEPELAGVR